MAIVLLLALISKKSAWVEKMIRFATPIMLHVYHNCGEIHELPLPGANVGKTRDVDRVLPPIESDCFGGQPIT
jgi:hypothetical protein